MRLSVNRNERCTNPLGKRSRRQNIPTGDFSSYDPNEAAAAVEMDSIFGPAIATSDPAPLQNPGGIQGSPFISTEWWGTDQSSLPLLEPPVGLGGLGESGVAQWQSLFPRAAPLSTEVLCTSCGCNPAVVTQLGKFDERFRAMEMLMWDIRSHLGSISVYDEGLTFRTPLEQLP
jgi:hypothetical protein